MVLKNLRSTLQADLLQLPIGDHLYTIPPPTAEDWLWLQAIYFSPAVKAVVDGDMPAAEDLKDQPTEVDLHRRALGATYDRMLADGVTIEELRIAGMTATIDAMHGRAIAEAYFEAGGNPNPEALTTQGDSDTSTAADPSTPSPDSPSGATAPTKAPPKARRGRSTSNTGT